MKQKDGTKQDQSGMAFRKLGWAKMNCPQSCNLSLLFHFFFTTRLDISQFRAGFLPLNEIYRAFKIVEV